MQSCKLMEPIFKLLAALFVAVLLAAFAGAQVDTGSVSGTVRDSSAAVVPGATVTLTNVAMGVSFQTTTNGSGNYQFPAVRVGTYRVAVEATGFASQVRDNVVVNIQQRFVADFALGLSQVAQNIEVSAELEQLQTQEASIGAVVQAQTINDLPLNGRNYTFLAQLNPGVVQSQQDYRGFNSSGSFAANGQSSMSNNYLLDGVDNNSNVSDYMNMSQYIYRPSVDALQEFKVQTSSYSAEFGRGSGAVLNASIKSGSEQFHGNLFEFHRNSAMDASNFFEKYNGVPKGKYIQNQFGGTLGGPVSFLNRGNRKTFFFLDYEGLTYRQSIPTRLNTATALMKQSNFTDLSELLTTGTRTDRLGRTFPLGTVMDPATTRLLPAGSVDPITGRTVTAGGAAWVRDPIDPTGNNILPANRIDQNALRLLQLLPNPTDPGRFLNYTVSPVAQQWNHQGDLRIDQYLGEKDTLFARFSYSINFRMTPGPYPNELDGKISHQSPQDMTTHGEVVSWTHIFSPTVVSELRFGFTGLHESRTIVGGDDLGIAAKYGLWTPQVPGLGGLPYFEVTGLANLGPPRFVPSRPTNSTPQVTSAISKLWGAHSLKFGGQFMRPNATFMQLRSSRGDYLYSGTFTDVPNTSGGNTGVAQMLLTPIANNQPLPECGTNVPAPCKASFVGGPNRIRGSNISVPVPEATWWIASGFIDDAWKVNSKLTLNLGLRYDYTRHSDALDGYGAHFLYEPTPTFVMAAGQCKKGLSPSFYSLTAQNGIAIDCASDNYLVKGPKGNFAPRIGLAYNFSPKWVIRSGFGVFYQTSERSDTIGLRTTYPYQFETTLTNLSPGLPIVYGDGSTATFESGIQPIHPEDSTIYDATQVSLKGTPSPWRKPYSMQYNLTLQHQLSASQSISVGYVGSQGRQGPLTYNYNAMRIMLPPGQNQRLYREFPDFGSVTQTRSGANSNYNSLQLTYDKRFTHGFAIRANHTYSKCRSNGRQFLTSNIEGARALWLTGPDWSLCETDITNLTNISASINLPFGRGQAFGANASGALNQLIGGWSINLIGAHQSGMPFSIPCTITTTTGQGCNALKTGEPLYHPDRNFEHWLNPAAFKNPPVATTIGQTDLSPLGSSDATPVRGPRFRKLDLSIFKTFPLTETQRFEFRAEIFNLTNTPNFSNPGYTGGGSGFPTPNGVLDFTHPNFGKITQLRNGPNDQRQIQMALKYYF